MAVSFLLRPAPVASEKQLGAGSVGGPDIVLSPGAGSVTPTLQRHSHKITGARIRKFMKIGRKIK